MKKPCVILVCFVLTGSVVQAQTSNGNMMIGGSFYFNSHTYELNSRNDGNSFAFSPSYGYFIRDNFVVGSGITVEASRSTVVGGKSTYRSFGFGPFARYYKFTSNDRFAFFAEAGLNFESAESEQGAAGIRKGRSIFFSLEPGAAYFLTHHWGVELSMGGLGFGTSNPDISNDNDKVNRIYFNLDSWSPSLAFRYHF